MFKLISEYFLLISRKYINVQYEIPYVDIYYRYNHDRLFNKQLLEQRLMFNKESKKYLIYPLPHKFLKQNYAKEKDHIKLK